MAHPLVQKIVDEGVSSVNISMLSPELRKQLMTDAGNRLLHANKYREAADAYSTGGNVEKLRDTARWFLEQRRFADAAIFLKPVGRPDELEHLAEQCVNAGHVNVAKELYEELGNSTMVLFLEQNFLRK